MLQANYVTAVIAIALLSTSLGRVQAAEREKQEVKTYRIADLILQPEDYGFDRAVKTTGGNGLFSVAEQNYVGQQAGFGEFGNNAESTTGTRPPRRPGIALRLTVADLLEIIGSNIRPESWDTVGGSGHVSYAAGLLVVSQTAECHHQIEHLLKNLRDQGATVNSLTIRAYWVATDDISSILTDHRIVDRKKLAESVAKKGAMAQISCFDGQTVYMVAGNERSTVSGVIPVVGQLQPDRDSLNESFVAHLPKHVLAQLDNRLGAGNAINESAIGYQPITSTQTEGCMLQISAVLDAKKKTAVIDVHSDVIHPNAAPGQHEFNGVTKLDKVDNVVQQFKTTLRLPTGQPILVGGATVRPMQNQGEAQHRQLHLVLEVLPD